MIEHINRFAELWWTWSTNMFWQVGLLIILIGCIDALVRKWAWPQVRYALWLMVLIKLVLPPSTYLSSSVTAHIQPWIVQSLSRSHTGDQHNEGMASYNSIYTINADAVTQPFNPSEPLEVVALPVQNNVSKSLPIASVAKPVWQVYAMGAWLIGMAILGTWLLCKLRRLHQGLPGTVCKTALPESFGALTERCARQMGLKRTPRVLVTNEVLCPAVTGIFKPVLLMPVGFLSRLSRKDAEHMLLHEFAHIRRGDLWIHSLYMALQITYWYNPLLWLVNRQMHHLREVCCDATVANRLRDKTIEYRDTLLDVARRYLAHPVEPGLGLLGLFEDSNRLAVRLNWLKKQTWRYQRLRWAMILCVVMMMALCVLPMAQAQPSKHTEAQHEDESPPVEYNDEQLHALEGQMQQLAEQMQKLHEQKEMLHAQLQHFKAQKMHEEAQQQQEVSQHEDAYAERWQEWAEQMKAWGERVKAWADSQAFYDKAKAYGSQLEDNFSDTFQEWQDSNEYQQWQKDLKVWEKDVAKWAQDLAEAGQSKWQHSRGQDGVEIKPMPSMPSMPPMPEFPNEFPKFKFDFQTNPKGKHKPIPHPEPHVVVPKIKMKHKDHKSQTFHGNSIAISSGDTKNKIVTQSIHQEKDGRSLIKRQESLILDLSSGSALDLVNEDGDINISGSDNEKCIIQTHVNVSAPTLEEAQALSDKVGFIASEDNQVLSIRAMDVNNLARDHSYSISYNLVLPRNTRLKLALEDGDMNVANMNSQIRIRQEDGDINCQKVSGDLDIKLEDGDIELEQCVFKDHCRITMEDGEIRAQDVSGNFMIKLEDGEVTMEYADAVPDDCTVDVRLEDGEITFSAPSAMFPDDLTQAKKRSEDGQQWSTRRKTDTGVRQVNLAVEDGEITVKQR